MEKNKLVKLVMISSAEVSTCTKRKRNLFHNNDLAFMRDSVCEAGMCRTLVIVNIAAWAQAPHRNRSAAVTENQTQLQSHDVVPHRQVCAEYLDLSIRSLLVGRTLRLLRCISLLDPMPPHYRR